MSNPSDIRVFRGALPGVGHALQLLRRPLEFITSMQGSGALARMRMGPEWAYLVQEPELVREILAVPELFDKGGQLYEAARSVIGNGLFTCPAHMHTRQRRLMQPGFTRERLAGYAEVMRESTVAAIAPWRDGQVLDLNQVMVILTFEIASRTMVTSKAAADLAAEIPQHFKVLSDSLFQRALLPFAWLHRLPLPGNRRFAHSVARLGEIIDLLIQEYRSAGIDQGDLLSALLNSQEGETGTERMTEQEVKDQVLTLLAAGTETTAVLLSWAFYLVGQHPEIERRMLAEVDEVLAGRSAGPQDVSRLELTQRVVNETLRLYPPAWILSRRTTAETELGGHRFPAGTTFILSSYAIQRDARFFPEPKRFDPDRWLPERAASIPRGAMVPFSHGKRRCIGDVFAMNEATIVLATVLGRWRLRPLPESPPRQSSKMSMSPGVLPMRLELRRQDAASPGREDSTR